MKPNTRPVLARPCCQTLIDAKIYVQKHTDCQESDGERAKHEEKQCEGLVADAALQHKCKHTRNTRQYRVILFPFLFQEKTTTVRRYKVYGNSSGYSNLICNHNQTGGKSLKSVHRILCTLRLFLTHPH